MILVLKLLNLRIWKTEVLNCDFPGIRNLFSPIDLSGLCNLTGLNSKCQFPQKNSDPDGLVITGTKITNTGDFLWNGTPKIQFSLILYGTLSNEGC